MGNWQICVNGVGCHHNGPNDSTDANNMAAKFVKELLAAGHRIENATFTYGGCDNLPDSHIPFTGVPNEPK
jgi:metal-dependent amidase/aminoacylase/carboxypeptidase family protein